MTTMDGLVREGMVRYVGCSNFSVEHAEVDRVCESLGLESPSRSSPSTTCSSAISRPTSSCTAGRSSSPSSAYSPLAGGFLTGKYRGAVFGAAARQPCRVE